ncbi:MAG: aspartate carbamoyltransferase regulatory subunit [Chlamydiales bacterium]
MKQLSVAAIENGSVIDHIKAGQGIRIIELLLLAQHHDKVTLGINLPSKSMVYKDLIKVEEREISKEEVNQIAMFAPQATIAIIRDFKVVEKYNVEMPQQIERWLKCPNNNCISNHEPLDTKFSVHVNSGYIELECYYCNRSFSHER